MRRFCHEQFNNAISEYLERSYLKLTVLALISGVSYSHLRKIRAGGAVPAANVLVAVADTVEKPLDYFFVQV